MALFKGCKHIDAWFTHKPSLEIFIWVTQNQNSQYTQSEI